MAQPDGSTSEPPLPPPLPGKQGFLRKLFNRPNGTMSSVPTELPCNPEVDFGDSARPGVFRRMSRKVVPGLPRAQTFKRQLSESRAHLAPVPTTTDERRAVSVDRRSRAPSTHDSYSKPYGHPRTSAPGFFGSFHHNASSQYLPSLPPSSPTEDDLLDEKLGGTLQDAEHLAEYPMHDAASMTDTHSMTTSQYDNLIHDELESKWILNLSMHFRDRSKREKFFVTYREHEHLWRRVTVSLDYRAAPHKSLEQDLIHTKFQKDKNAKIYEAIRESLADIQFYDTVTNLKLQTTDGRLHVHVVEDGNEIIPYPSVNQFRHLSCPRIRERDITFGSHMSGFVYKVTVHNQVFIKKEIPGPDTIEEFIYEVNALSRLHYSDNVIKFYGIVVDDDDMVVKGLLIDYADQGPLVDLIYDHCKESHVGLPWATKERWARQIVHGLSDIHESGFVQGDFTLSNIVIDDFGDAKIIDINRRGCPMGWEPPEATGLLDSGQRISMYIGVKSDLFQLGMVLWALAMEEDEPDLHGRPLILGPEVNVPDWYRQMAEICLSDEPRQRIQASSLLRMFPPMASGHDRPQPVEPPISVDDGYSLREYTVDGYHEDGYPLIRTVEPPSGWSDHGRTYADADLSTHEPYYYTRGRSPPSPLPSNGDRCESLRGLYGRSAWAANRNIPPSYSDVGADDVAPDEVSQQPTPTPIADRGKLGGSDDVGVTTAKEALQEAATKDDRSGGDETPTGVVQATLSGVVEEANVPDLEPVPDSHETEVEIEKSDSPELNEDLEHPFDVEGATKTTSVTPEPKLDAPVSTEETDVLPTDEPLAPPQDVFTDDVSINKAVDTRESMGEETMTKMDGASIPEEPEPANLASVPEPKHTTPTVTGNTVPVTLVEQSPDLPASSVKEPDTKTADPTEAGASQPADEAASAPPPPTETKATGAPTPTELSRAPSQTTTRRPSETTLPESFIGIGSHVTIDDRLMQDPQILEADFDMEKRADAPPTLMITTDTDM